MAFKVRSGSSISSVIYRIRRDGRERRIRMIAGRIVQMHFTSCASTVFEDNFSISVSARR